MELLVQSGKYGTMNTKDSTTMGYYDMKFASEAYTLKENTTRDRQISTSGELIAKAQYLIFIKEKTSGIGRKKSSNKSYMLKHALMYIHIFMYLYWIISEIFLEVFAIETN